tara:strand:- start:159 stop:626 length:468 start_codon:yes stop_codon:yes gene_type:complete
MSGKMTKKNLKSTWITKLKKNLTTELAIVYLTSDDTKFLDEYEAVIYEASLDETETTKRRWIEMKTKIAEIVCEILKEKQWGIFFKNEPIQALPVQDSTMVYKVNEVKQDELLDAIEYKMERMDAWQSHQAEKEQNPITKESSNGMKQTLSNTEE